MLRNSRFVFVGGAGAAFAVACFLIDLESRPPPRRLRLAERDDGEPDAQERPHAGHPANSRNAVSGPIRDQGSGPGAQAAPARRVRANGQRDRTVAAGAGPGTLRFLTLPFGACAGIPPSPTCGIQPTPSPVTRRGDARFSRPAWPSRHAPPAIHDRTGSGSAQ